MVSKKFEKQCRGRGHTHIKADVIVLGCSLPGIVAAHKLKKRFGNSMDIVVLDLAGTAKTGSKCNVAFQEEEDEGNEEYVYDGTAKDLIDNVARHYLKMYAKDFNIQLPDAIMAPESLETSLDKLFEYKNGSFVKCAKDYHDFEYLNILERFELNQYQTVLDQNMRDLFQAHQVDDSTERRRLLYYDHTTMEEHLCNALLFSNSREIMRNIVRLVCGVSADTVSVLFYLHQCYRTSSARNHLDGNNTRFREKLVGYCRKHLASKLRKSIVSITLSAKAIKEISLYSDEEVILTTIKGETDYVCNLLAMALKPDQLMNISVEDQLISESDLKVFSSMKQGIGKKFLIQYEDNFWRKDGYSGDILSVRGPIIWATERPKMSSTGSLERYAALIGYLRVTDDHENDCKEAVIEQLVRLFGEEAAEPVSYRETFIVDIYVPRCGDFVTLRRLLERTRSGQLEWAALDIFADGDVAAALEAGHTAYLHLLSFLRPQAQTYEDVRTAEWPTILNEYNPLKKLFAYLNITSTGRILVYTSIVYFSVRLAQAYLKKQ